MIASSNSCQERSEYEELTITKKSYTEKYGLLAILLLPSSSVSAVSSLVPSVPLNQLLLTSKPNQCYVYQGLVGDQTGDQQILPINGIVPLTS